MNYINITNVKNNITSSYIHRNMDSSGIYNITYNEAQAKLEKWNSQDCDIMKEIKNVIATWNFSSESNLNEIKKDLTNIIQYISEYFFSFKQNSLSVYITLHCVVFNLLYEHITMLIKIKCEHEDAQFNEKCRHIWNLKTNPCKSARKDLTALPFTSSIVELSMLDNHQSPVEKLKCLCSTYDLIYAELKSFMISFISKYSEKEMEIPVVNNHEIIPIISFILIRSKLLYFFSNLLFIKEFANDILDQDVHSRNVLKHFESAAQKILDISEEALKSDNAVISELSTTDAIEMLTNICSRDNIISCNLKDEHEKRYVSLIMLSTDETFIPTNT